jgi:pimeloyl-ACP methyl ester carboxylesterase
MTPAAIAAVGDAMRRLGARADAGRFALVGHSLGGIIAANLAAAGGSGGVPRARALMVVHPGDADNSFKRVPSIAGDLGAIPADVLLAVMVGADDAVVGRGAADRLWRATAQIPAANKAFYVVHPDAHGAPAIGSGHFAPLAGGRSQPDALDWYGYWRHLDALCSAAFTGADRAIALGAGAEAVDLGRWSDGQPIVPLEPAAP